MSSADGVLSDRTVTSLQGIVVGIAVSGLFFGIFFVLAVLAAFTLFRQGFRDSPARCILMLAISIMFVSSTGIFGVSIAFDLVQIRGLGGSGYDPTNAIISMEEAMTILPRINYVISDVIVVWRAWVILNESLVFRTILAGCFLGTIVSTFVDMALTLKGIITDNNLLFGTRKLILLLPLLLTNITATSLIAYKIWIYRTSIKVHIEYNSAHKTRVERILSALVESGLVYCFFWVLAIITVFGSLSVIGEDTLSAMLPIISSIYPTIVILIAQSQKDGENTTLVIQSGGATHSIRFASSPGARSGDYDSSTVMTSEAIRTQG